MLNIKLRTAIGENPMLVMLLGVCPALAVTATLENAVWMAAAVAALVVVTSLFAWASRALVSDGWRIPVILVLLAGLVTALQLLMQAYLPNVYSALGLYPAAVAVSLLVFGEAERAARLGHIGTVIKSSILTSLCFALVLCVTATVRELLCYGSIWGISIEFMANVKLGTGAYTAMGFIVLALVLALVKAVLPVKAPLVGEDTACEAVLCKGCEMLEKED